MYFAHGGNWVRLGNHSDITSYSNATTSADGLMSSADKTKLDGVATSANNYTLPTASSSTLGGIKIGSGLSIDGSGVVTASGGGGGGGSFSAINVASRIINSDTTVSATESALSVGPIEIANGVTLTVASGGRHLVL
jgi:hypothetical protein